MSDYWINISVDHLGQIRVKITFRNKTIFDDSAYQFKQLVGQYNDKLKELFSIPELKKHIEKNGYKIDKLLCK